MIGKLNDSINWWLAFLVVFCVVLFCMSVAFFAMLNLSVLLIKSGSNWHGYSARGVVADYWHIIGYLQWWPKNLHMSTLPISEHALRHFADVKRIVIRLQLLTVFSAMATLIGLWYEKKNYQLWRLVVLFPVIMILLLVVIGCLALSFNDSFILMHHLLFNNQYWVFSAKTDPIILWLSFKFFENLFLLWMLFSSLLLYLFRHWLSKMIN